MGEEEAEASEGLNVEDVGVEFWSVDFRAVHAVRNPLKYDTYGSGCARHADSYILEI